jgi:hypothetical protein
MTQQILTMLTLGWIALPFLVGFASYLLPRLDSPESGGWIRYRGLL